MTTRFRLTGIVFALLSVFVVMSAAAQDTLPRDNGLFTYHTSPRYRESESHPLRIFAYAFHPVGWVLREGIFRPFSYFASSTEVTRSVMGYREPYDYRNPECFSADDIIPDCRAISPFNYDADTTAAETEAPAASSFESSLNQNQEPTRQVYFPDVNFDFDRRALNDLGKGRSRQIANLLNEAPGLKVVLQGHADYVGSENYNEKLGMDRSEAVREELVRLGVPAERLSSVTFGKSQPVFSEQEDWARAVNRRVEVHADTGK